jgi:hypothetical protein
MFVQVTMSCTFCICSNMYTIAHSLLYAVPVHIASCHNQVSTVSLRSTPASNAMFSADDPCYTVQGCTHTSHTNLCATTTAHSSVHSQEMQVCLYKLPLASNTSLIHTCTRILSCKADACLITVICITPNNTPVAHAFSLLVQQLLQCCADGNCLTSATSLQYSGQP